MDRIGDSINESTEAQIESILKAHDFDSKTAIPKDVELWKKQCKENYPQNKVTNNLEKEAKKIYKSSHKNYKLTNVSEAVSLLIKTERDRSDCVYISIDEVCVKKQKFKRKTKSTTTSPKVKNNTKKRAKTIKNNNARRREHNKVVANYERQLKGSYMTDGRFIYTPVAHVSWDNNKIILTGKGLPALMKQVVALLLENQLLTTRKLVFLVDGARNIKNIIESSCFYTNYTIILDWYHASNTIKTILNPALRCADDDKNKYINQIVSKLWFGDLEGLITDLHNLYNQKIISSKSSITKIEGYLNRKGEFLPNYALRKEKGLPNSSNAVEQANNILASNRQKGNGTSWVAMGSHSLSLIQATICNNKLDDVIKNKSNIQWFIPTTNKSDEKWFIANECDISCFAPNKIKTTSIYNC